MIKYKRKGDAAARNDVPITVEIVQPGETADQEGTSAQSKNVTAKTTEQQVSLSGGESARGCATPWRVRIKHTNEGNAPLAVYGDISVTFNDSQRNLSIQDAGSINLESRNTVTVNVGNSTGLEQGSVVIKGEWYHNAGVLPIKMKFELLDPNGTPVDSAERFAQNEVNPCCSGSKLRLSFNVATCKRGQWKLRIKNISDGHDAARVKPIVTVNPSCPD